MRLAPIFLVFCGLLMGCNNNNIQMKQAMELRKAVLDAQSCSFTAVITADYGEEIYTFQMNCKADNSNAMDFTITDPETIDI